MVMLVVESDGLGCDWSEIGGFKGNTQLLVAMNSSGMVMPVAVMVGSCCKCW